LSVTHSSQQPAIQLLSHDQARGLQRSLIGSCKWWVVPIANGAGIELVAAIESRFYSGPANRDFLLLFGPLPVVFARKKRMPAVALAKLLTELRPLPEWSAERWRETLTEQDILCALPGDADEGEVLVRLHFWHAWLAAGP
jgi:hypothetical protein